MSLYMDQANIHDAYGPNGPDEEDVAVWHEAVDRNCQHEAAHDYMSERSRPSCCCPDCGSRVAARSAEEQEAADERDHDEWMRSRAPGGQW